MRRPAARKPATRAESAKSAAPLTIAFAKVFAAAVHPSREAVQHWDGKAPEGPKTPGFRAQDG
jgi:hypothetical protein